MPRKKTNYRIGTSGWQYGDWKGVFYPAKLKPTDWIRFYSKKFSTVEVNATFYRKIKSETFKKWYLITPRDFLFSIKISREITHFKRLKIEKSLIGDFLRRLTPLKEKLGVILIQLPPSLKFDSYLLSDFCEMLSKKHKYAIEVRNRTFLNDNFLNILKKHNIAFCIADTAGRHPYYEAITTDFIYIRLHGSKSLYTSQYTTKELKMWTSKIEKWNLTTYIYFDNDYKGYAVKNALKLEKLLAQP